MTILNGIMIGTTIAIAVSKAVNVKNLFFFIEYIPFSTVYTVVYTITLQNSILFYKNKRIFMMKKGKRLLAVALAMRLAFARLLASLATSEKSSLYM